MKTILAAILFAFLTTISAEAATYDCLCLARDAEGNQGDVGGVTIHGNFSGRGEADAAALQPCQRKFGRQILRASCTIEE